MPWGKTAHLCKAGKGRGKQAPGTAHWPGHRPPQVVHACSRSRAPGRSSEVWDSQVVARARRCVRGGGGGLRKWVGGKTSPPSHHGERGSLGSWGQSQDAGARPGGHLPPAARSPLGPRRPTARRGREVTTTQAAANPHPSPPATPPLSPYPRPES